MSFNRLRMLPLLLVALAPLACLEQETEGGEGEGEGEGSGGEGEGLPGGEGEGECEPGAHLDCDSPCPEQHLSFYHCGAEGFWQNSHGTDARTAQATCTCRVIPPCPGPAQPAWDRTCSTTGEGAAGPEIPQIAEPDAPLADCANLETRLRQRALSRAADVFRQSLDQALTQVRSGEACERYWSRAWELYCADDPGSEGEGEAGGNEAAARQEEGVDEADFVKLDGDILYLLTPTGLHLLDASPAAETHLLASHPIAGEPRKLFVHDGLALIYSALGPATGTCSSPREDCDPAWIGRQTHVTVLDLSDLEHPRLVREQTFGGSYLGSARIGQTVHTVLEFPTIFPFAAPRPMIDWQDLGPEFDEQAIRRYVVEQFERYAQELEQVELGDELPRVEEVFYDPQGQARRVERDLVDCGSLQSSGMSEGRALLAVVSQRLDGDGALAVATVLDRRGVVYVTQRSLYLASSILQMTTTIHQFELGSDPSGASYVGSGQVEGRWLDQFSFSEWEGRLRVATTVSPVSPTTTTVSILAPAAGRLEVVGQLGGLSGYLRSARFVQDRGYVGSGPLSFLDLSDPEHPVVVATRRNDSTYIYPLGDQHLLLIGRAKNANPGESSVELQLFDVSDLANPLDVDRENIGIWNNTQHYRAFDYFARQAALAFPLGVCERDDDGSSALRMTFSGLKIYRASAEGLEPWGQVAHEAPAESCPWRSGGFSTRVKRSLVVDDSIISLSDELLKVNSLEDLSRDLVTLRLDEL